jgi:ABC-type antimicrobial peptide transport system permease subunit
LEDGPVRAQRLLVSTYTAFAIGLACLALGLAAVGVYGVMAYMVNQRIREIGIQMALGAGAGGILRSVVLTGLRPVFVGAGVGLAAAAAISGLLKSLVAFPSSPDVFFGVSAFDPATFIGLTVFLALVAACASAIPAWRATHVDPVVALRYE